MTTLARFQRRASGPARDPLARALEDALRGGSHEPECPRFGHPSRSGHDDGLRCACWVARSAAALAGYLRQEGLI